MTVQLQMSFLQTEGLSIISGVTYIPEYISAQQEESLLLAIDNQPWLTDLKRLVQHYGYRYDYKARIADSKLYLGELPGWLKPHCEQLYSKQLFPQIPDQVIVNEYQPGQGISAHIDCIQCFAETIASLSLGSSCVMDFIHTETQQKISLLLEPRSLIILSGEARYNWKHAIVARKTDAYDGQSLTRGRRVSLTFRNMILSKP